MHLEHVLMAQQLGTDTRATAALAHGPRTVQNIPRFPTAFAGREACPGPLWMCARGLVD